MSDIAFLNAERAYLTPPSDEDEQMDYEDWVADYGERREEI